MLLAPIFERTTGAKPAIIAVISLFARVNGALIRIVVAARRLRHERQYFLRQGDTMKRKASAVWKGGLKDGKGTISTESGVLSDTQYGYKSRFENGPGTNPEELIAAAHAGCFSMALSSQLGEAKLTAESIRTTASVSLDMIGGKFSITAVHLDLVAKIPGASKEAFETAANNAKAGCPVSRVLSAKITLDARLES